MNKSTSLFLCLWLHAPGALRDFWWDSRLIQGLHACKVLRSWVHLKTYCVARTISFCFCQIVLKFSLCVDSLAFCLVIYRLCPKLWLLAFELEAFKAIGQLTSQLLHSLLVGLLSLDPLWKRVLLNASRLHRLQIWNGNLSWLACQYLSRERSTNGHLSGTVDGTFYPWGVYQRLSTI